MNRFLLRNLLLGLFTLLPVLAKSGLAQAKRARISGSVQSNNHQVLPGATITVLHLPTGTQRKVNTDAGGSFAVPNLPTGGPYKLLAEQSGYTSKMLENVFLTSEEPVVYTLVLDATKPANAPATKPVNQAAQRSYAPLRGATYQAPPTPTSIQQAELLPRPAPPPAQPVVRYARANRYAAAARKPAPKGAAPVVSGHYDAKSGNYIYETGAPTTIKLPNGRTIADVGVKSTESNLYRFLTDPKTPVDTVNLTQGWLNFDRVYFETGKATLTKESTAQLRNIAILMQAFPQSRIKIGGYTDSLGAYKMNKQLSEARARTAWAALVDMGVGPGRIDARGYGPRYAIAPNTTEEGRAMNRRLSIKVLAK